MTTAKQPHENEPSVAAVGSPLDRQVRPQDLRDYADDADQHGNHWVPISPHTLRAVVAEIESLRLKVHAVRPMDDVAERLDAAISWLRDGVNKGRGVGVADFVALRALMRTLQDASAALGPNVGIQPRRRRRASWWRNRRLQVNDDNLLASDDVLREVHRALLATGNTLQATQVRAAAMEARSLRTVIRRAASILHGGEGVTDQGDAWDKALRLLDATVAEFDA